MRRIGAILALAAAAAALWLGLHRHPPQVAGAPAVAVPAGEASPATAADRVPQGSLAAGVKIPERLPSFTLHALDGRPSPIDRFAHRSLVINFWATWCGPCRREIPLLEKVAAAASNRDLAVVGIAVDHREAVAEFARRLHISYALMIGEDDALAVATSLGVAEPAFPFTVFTDDRRRIVALYLGELHRPQIDLILGMVRRVNAGQIDLPAAREAIANGLASLNPA